MNSKTTASTRIFEDLPLLNIEIIDEQHAKLFELFDKLNILVTETSDFKLTLTKIEEFKVNVYSHFEVEEKLMKSALVDDVEDHIQEHLFFKIKFEEFIKMNEVESKIMNRLNNNMLICFLQRWLFHHIKNSDSLYVQSIQQYLAMPRDKDR